MKERKIKIKDKEENMIEKKNEINTEENVVNSEENNMKKKMSKKKKGLIIGISIAVVLAAIASAFLLYNPLTLKNKDMNVEFGEKISVEAKSYLDGADKKIVKNTKVEVFTIEGKDDNKKAKKIDSVKDFEFIPGNYEVVLTYNGFLTKEKTVNVKIADTTAPKFNKAVESDIETIEGVELDFNKLITASDLSECNITFDTKKVDLNKPGEYTLKAVAEDIYGNKNEKEIKVIVKEKPANMSGSDVSVDPKTGKVTVKAKTSSKSSESSIGKSYEGTYAGSGKISNGSTYEYYKGGTAPGDWVVIK